MKAFLYSVKDNVAGRFLAPNLFPSDLVMKRAVGSAVNGSAGTLLADYPGDCAIYKVGEFDDETGKIELGDPEFLFNAIDLKEVKADA